MSFDPDTIDDADEQLDSLAAKTGASRDPLAEYSGQMKGTDAFAIWWAREVDSQSLAKRTRADYRRQLSHWYDWMDEQERHPALPSEQHVRAYVIDHLQNERGVLNGTVKQKLEPIKRAFDFFSRQNEFPHPMDSNIVKHVLNQIDLDEQEDVAEYPPLELADVRDFVQDIDHIRDQCIITIGLKTGMRAGEIANIQLQDIHLDNQLHDHYDELGTHPMLQEHGRAKALHVPANREGTKSVNNRTFPIDKELQQTLTKYLLIRPDNGEDELFLSSSQHRPMQYRAITEIWGKHVVDRYDSDRYRPVTSHFARHFFTDFWGVEMDMNMHLVQYMRGDSITVEAGEVDPQMTEYLHPEYNDIETTYRQDMYQLRI